MSTANQKQQINPGIAAALSLFMPGLGQVAQLRLATGLGTVVAYAFSWLFFFGALGTPDMDPQWMRSLFLVGPLAVLFLSVRDAAVYKG